MKETLIGIAALVAFFALSFALFLGFIYLVVHHTTAASYIMLSIVVVVLVGVGRELGKIISLYTDL